MFKYHSDSLVSVTFNPGDQNKTVDVTHSLGYVPAHIVLWQGSSLTSKQRLCPYLSANLDINGNAYAFADSSKIQCKMNLIHPYNQINITSVADGYSNGGLGNDSLLVGNNGGAANDCGYRFTNVGAGVYFDDTLPQGATIDSASVEFRVDTKYGSNDVSIKTWGIDEDNVGSFGSDLGKAKTDAYSEQNVAAGSGSYFGINVKDQVQEIVNRAGWATSNAMGFYTFNNGTPNDRVIEDELIYPGSANNTQLQIRKSGTVTVYFRVIIFKDKIV